MIPAARRLPDRANRARLMGLDALADDLMRRLLDEAAR